MSIWQLKRTRKTEITQEKLRTLGVNYLGLNPNVKQRKKHTKSARTAKRHSRNQNKKTNNENNNIVCVQKMMQDRKKRREKRKQQKKIIYNGKQTQHKTVKARKGSKITKHHNKRPTLATNQVVNRLTIFFSVSTFKKNQSIKTLK